MCNVVADRGRGFNSLWALCYNVSHNGNYGTRWLSVLSGRTHARWFTRFPNATCIQSHAQNALGRSRCACRPRGPVQPRRRRCRWHPSLLSAVARMLSILVWTTAVKLAICAACSAVSIASPYRVPQRIVSRVWRLPRDRWPCPTDAAIRPIKSDQRAARHCRCPTLRCTSRAMIDLSKAGNYGQNQS